jgi:hypothetical protein
MSVSNASEKEPRDILFHFEKTDYLHAPSYAYRRVLGTPPNAAQILELTQVLGIDARSHQGRDFIIKEIIGIAERFCLSLSLQEQVPLKYVSDRIEVVGAYGGHGNRIELSYIKDGEALRYPVRLTETPCHLGGARRWFVCPAVGCQRRAAKLYLGNRYFACRRCYNLAYQSQSESIFDRAFRQAEKIKCSIGGEPGIDWPLSEKPRRMRWRTYERLRQRYERHVESVDYSRTRFAKRWPELIKELD